jgi:hypothetical protein
VPIVLKTRSLNFLGPTEPVQACNGIVFFTIDLIYIVFIDKEKKTALVTDTAVFLTHNLFNTVARES